VQFANCCQTQLCKTIVTKENTNTFAVILYDRQLNSKMKKLELITIFMENSYRSWLYLLLLEMK